MDRASRTLLGAMASTLFVLILTLLLTACGPGEAPTPESPGTTVRDSAGVAIVESTRPAWPEGAGWRLSPQPLLTIGVMEGPEEYTFFRAIGAMRLGDGRILVVNTGTQELRFYGPQGTFLHATGSDGEGPGEFRSLGFTWRSELDSLFAYDFGLRRFAAYDPYGTLARNFQIGQHEGEFAFPEGVFADGTILAVVDEGDQGNYEAMGFVRGNGRYGRYDGGGHLMATLASLPGAELYKGTHDDGSAFTTNADHAARPYAAAAGSTWFYGSSEAFELQERGQEGDLLKVIRLDRRRRAMPDALREAREEELREMNPRARALWGRIPLPDSLPTHEELLVDRAGNLWVKGYVVLDEAPYWMVFDGEGRWLGDFPQPEGLRITEVGEDYLLGIHADTLGIQRIHLYGLDKGGAGQESNGSPV